MGKITAIYSKTFLPSLKKCWDMKGNLDIHHILFLHVLIYIYIYMCVCVTFLCGFVRCRENYIITSPPYFMKNISTCVFCFTVRCVFPRIQWGTKWKIRNFGSLTRAPAGGRKKICGDSLKEALDKLHDVNLTDIMQQWVEPSLPSLQWQ